LEFAELEKAGTMPPSMVQPPASAPQPELTVVQPYWLTAGWHWRHWLPSEKAFAGIPASLSMVQVIWNAGSAAPLVLEPLPLEAPEPEPLVLEMPTAAPLVLDAPAVEPLALELLTVTPLLADTPVLEPLAVELLAVLVATVLPDVEAAAVEAPTLVPELVPTAVAEVDPPIEPPVEPPIEPVVARPPSHQSSG
jgi:hypothetical protein